MYSDFVWTVDEKACYAAAACGGHAAVTALMADNLNHFSHPEWTAAQGTEVQAARYSLVALKLRLRCAAQGGGGGDALDT